jgi:glycosyltransferase involved in cell wall biosynthesis
MATGTPVLISKFDGFWEKDIFINDENIFFIDHFKYDDWANLIRKLNKNPQLVEKVSMKGIDLIKNKYNLEIFVKKIEKLVETIT